MIPLNRRIFHHFGVRAAEPEWEWEWERAADVRETVSLSMWEPWPVWSGSVTAPAPAPAPARDPEGDLPPGTEVLLWTIVGGGETKATRWINSMGDGRLR